MGEGLGCGVEPYRSLKECSAYHHDPDSAETDLSIEIDTQADYSVLCRALTWPYIRLKPLRLLVTHRR
jgi:hypothetical protein